MLAVSSLLGDVARPPFWQLRLSLQTKSNKCHTWMDRAFTLAEANEASGGVRNAAVTVDPVLGET